MVKSITVLGSTGSIGASALKVIRFLGSEYRVFGLSCRKNLAVLEEQIKEFCPEIVAICSRDKDVEIEAVRIIKKYPKTRFIIGEDAAVDLAGCSVDVIVSAIVGAAGLKPSLEAIKSSKRVALANKETLVMAGDLFISETERNGVELIPVDSEHNAIFSLVSRVPHEEIERIILTASGGSLREIAIEELPNATPGMALNHPTWSMGSKITIDSATMMNKGLEVIEAHHLFSMGYDRIDVVIHPESIVHSMIETIDGALYASLGIADMCHPILNALKYPKKVRNDFGRLDLVKEGRLNFLECDKKRYPALDLCYSAGISSGTMPAVLNAANEVAVDAFLNERISFSDIVRIVEKTMESHNNISNPGLDDILHADMESREKSRSLLLR